MAVSVVTRPFEMPTQPKVLPKVTWQNLIGPVKESLIRALEGVPGDLQLIAADIAPVLVSAMAAGDTKLKEELVVQLELIADIHKIQANAEFWTAVKSTANTVLSIGAGILGNLITKVV